MSRSWYLGIGEFLLGQAIPQMIRIHFPPPTITIFGLRMFILSENMSGSTSAFRRTAGSHLRFASNSSASHLLDVGPGRCEQFGVVEERLIRLVPIAGHACLDRQFLETMCGMMVGSRTDGIGPTLEAWKPVESTTPYVEHRAHRQIRDLPDICVNEARAGEPRGDDVRGLIGLRDWRLAGCQVLGRFPCILHELTAALDGGADSAS